MPDQPPGGKKTKQQLKVDILKPLHSYITLSANIWTQTSATSMSFSLGLEGEEVLKYRCVCRPPFEKV